MKTAEGFPIACSTCPRRDNERAGDLAPVTGALLRKAERYINAKLEFIGSPEDTPGVASQPWAVNFYDANDKMIGPFMAGTTLEDVAQCNGPVEKVRGPFWRRERWQECGADYDIMMAFRDRIVASRERRKAEAKANGYRLFDK